MSEHIKKLAAQAELIINIEGEWYSLRHDFTHLERFAELVRQDAMEEAAKICDELNYNGMNSLHCAQAIRNRAEEINE